MSSQSVPPNPLDLWGLDAATLGAPATPKKKWTPKPVPPNPTPLDPIDQASWDALSPKAKWDSIVALRGPDLIGSDSLKWFTTSVIRYRLSKIMRVGGMVNNSLGFVVLPVNGYSSRKTSPFDIGHFLNHVAEAAAWTGIPVAHCKTETFEKILSGDFYHRGKIYSILIEELPSPFKDRLSQLAGKDQEGGDSCPE